MRRRGKDPNEAPRVKPVQSIELSERSPVKKIILAAILLLIGLGFLGYALLSMLSREKGWTKIEPVSKIAESVESELTFLYDLGRSGNSPTSEYKELSYLYTDLCTNAYKLFSADRGFDGVKNLHYINRHTNQEIKVAPSLYKAFEKIVSANNRFIFAAPFYREYGNIFIESEDNFAATLDPYKSVEISEYFSELSMFTSNPEHVNLELLGDNTVKLNVSNEYAAYAKQNGIENYIDLYWTRNAFAVDMIADELIAKGYAYGSISSYNGFMRVIDKDATKYSYQIYGKYSDNIYNAARLDYTGKNSVVFLKAYPISTQDDIYYTYKNGEIRHAYVDVNDGLCKNSREELISYSYDKGCVDVLLAMIPVFISDEFSESMIEDMKVNGIYSVYFSEKNINYNDPSISFGYVYKDDKIEFIPVK